MKYQDIIRYLNPEDWEYIKDMPEPNERQVVYVKNIWENSYKDKEIRDRDMLLFAKIYGRLYVKCRETKPELFI